MKFKVPESLARGVSEKAVTYARQEVFRRGWSTNAALSLQAYSSDGKVGIRTTLPYLLYQEKGIRPFLMKSLEGKRIPIGDHVVFAKDVGKPGFVKIPRGDGTYITKYREQKWRHPGIKPQRFMGRSVSRAILEERRNITSEIVRRLKG